jgi:hypothetical protein
LFKIFEAAGWEQGFIAYRTSDPERLAGVTVLTHGAAPDIVKEAAHMIVRALNTEQVLTQGPQPTALGAIPVDQRIDGIMDAVCATIVVNIG